MKRNGAILDVMLATDARPDGAGVDTHCPYCALQCAMRLSRDESGAVAVSGRDFPVNRGGLCHKGWTSAEPLRAPDRLTAPLMRMRPGDPLVPTTWPSVMARIAKQVMGLAASDGPDTIAVFGGGGLTNEKAYSLGKFARMVLGTSMIDYNGRFCMSSAAAAGNRAFGLDRGLPFPVTDLDSADAVLLVGANVAETMPPFVRHLTVAKENGGQLIVVDPRRTATAALADIHLQPVPGTDLALALGLLHVIINEQLVADEYVAERTGGFAAVRARVASYWPEHVERLTGVGAVEIRRAARTLARADRAYVLTARGAEQHSKGVDTVNAFTNLALALGLPGTQGSGYGCITGQGNGQGGREHGQKADQLPGYRSISDPAARKHVADVWGIEPEEIPGPGISAYELLDRLGTANGPRALFVFGSNPVVSAPNARHIEERLRALDLLVVADPFLSETAAIADVVLPVAQWAEEEGTTTNLEGRVIRRRRLVEPPPGVRTDLAVLADLSSELGRPGAIRPDANDMFDELCLASAGGAADYSGMTYDDLDATGGSFWPFGATASSDSPVMFLDRFATPDGRARFIDVDHREIAEPLDTEYPYYLCTGRVLAQYQSGTQTRRVPDLVAAAPESFVSLHPSLARTLEISEGDLVHVRSRRGTACGPARFDRGVRIDTVFMAFHWAGAGSANNLTNDALDPISRMPEFKVCAVNVTRSTTNDHRDRIGATA